MTDNCNNIDNAPNGKVIKLGEARINRGSVRMEIVESDPSGMPELLNLIPAQIDDHDSFASQPVKNVWPNNLSPSTLKLHQHFCELIAAWNLNPFRHRDSLGVAAVDSFAETSGLSRFSFTSKGSLDDFLEYYFLDDFVVRRIDATRSDAFHFVELTNKFLPSEIELFFTTYRDAMQSLAEIAEERNRAIRYDGNRVGHVLVDHFCARETYELMRIKQARIELGASGLERQS